MTLDKEYKVVRILDEYRIVVNAGSDHGVTLNSLFKILGVIDKIIDPETLEHLGDISGVKACVVPTEIHAKFTVCRNSEVISPFTHAIKANVGLFMQTPKKLNVEKSQIANGQDVTIRIGDKAVLTVSEPTLVNSNAGEVSDQPDVIDK
jgi:hypothetical protein